MKKTIPAVLLFVCAFVLGFFVTRGRYLAMVDSEALRLTNRYESEIRELEKTISDNKIAHMEELQQAKDSADERYEELVASITEEQKKQIKDEIRPKAEEELRAEVMESLRAEAVDEVKAELASTLTPEIKEELRAAYSEEVKESLKKELKDSVEKELREELDPIIREQITAIYNQENKEVSGEYVCEADGTYLVSVAEKYYSKEYTADQLGGQINVTLFNDIEKLRKNRFDFDELYELNIETQEVTFYMTKGQVVRCLYPYTIKKVR